MIEPTDDPQNEPPTKDASTWQSEIEAAMRDMQSYNKNCDRIRKIYRYDNARTTNARKFQVFWANIETMKPAVYTKVPKALVQSRFKTQDKVANTAGMMLERTVQFQFDVNDYDRALKQVRNDYLLYARGLPRLRYEPTFDENQIEDGLDDKSVSSDAPVGDDTDSEVDDPAQTLKFENVQLDYVQRDDFIHPKARTWEELPWVAYRAFLSRPQAKKRFPDDWKQLAYEDPDTAQREDAQRCDSSTAKATIYEIWDKVNCQVLWIAKGHADILEQGKPYLNFTGFYPSPRPAFGTLTNDSLEPRPDFIYYQDQVEEVNQLTARIGSLTDALKMIGFYPSGPQGEGAPEIERAMTPGVENKMIAVKSWAVFAEAGKGGAPIIWLPVENVAKIIVECINLRKQLLDDIFQITGISDIMRGDTEAEETASAQKMKMQSGQSRMKDRKDEMSRVARDVVRMTAELISEQFEITTLMEVSGIRLPSQQDVDAANAQQQMQFQQVMQNYPAIVQQAQAQGQPPPPQPAPPQPVDLGPTQEDVIGLLRNGVTRRFELDIETDSTVAADEAQDRADRTAFIQAMSEFIMAWGPIVQQQPQLIPLACAALKFGVQAFPVAREMMDVIDETMDKLQEAAQNPQPPQPDPKTQAQIQIAQTKAQAEQQKAQTEGQTAQFQARADMAKTQMEAQLDAQKMAMESQHAQQEHAMDMQAKGADHQIAQAEGAMKMRTMNQTMQIAEQKFEAQQALAAMKPKPTNGSAN